MDDGAEAKRDDRFWDDLRLAIIAVLPDEIDTGIARDVWDAWDAVEIGREAYQNGDPESGEMALVHIYNTLFKYVPEEGFEDTVFREDGSPLSIDLRHAEPDEGETFVEAWLEARLEDEDG